MKFIWLFLRLEIGILFLEEVMTTHKNRHGIPNFRHQNRHNSRTRFLNRMQNLGADKIEQIRTGQLITNTALPTGFALIDGKVMDISNKLVQKISRDDTGYFVYSDKDQSFPIFQRPYNEAGYHFVLFQDPFFWRGSGHLILLKKVPGVNPNNVAKVGKYNLLYEAYIISLKATMHPQVDLYDMDFLVRLQKKKELVQYIKGLRNASDTVQASSSGNELKEPELPSQTRRKRSASGTGRRKKNKLRIHFNFNTGTECYIQALNLTKLLARMKQQRVKVLNVTEGLSPKFT